MPDLCRIHSLKGLQPVVSRGVQLHRKIDTWTDTHPAFSTTRARLFPTHGRFSGILTDIFYDHVLAVDWHKWHNSPLSDFIANYYQAMADNPSLMPFRMRMIVDRMAQDDWLGCYNSVEGMRIILGRMSMRFTERFDRDIDLRPGADTLADLLPEIRSDFQQLYPDLITRGQAFIEASCLSDPSLPTLSVAQ